MKDPNGRFDVVYYNRVILDGDAATQTQFYARARESEMIRETPKVRCVSIRQYRRGRPT
jgi:hypothetical protein